MRYSQAQIQWSWQYGVISLIGIFIFGGLWLGFRNNQIEDEKKRHKQKVTTQIEKERLKRLESLSPKKK